MSHHALFPSGGLGTGRSQRQEDGVFLAVMARIEEKVLDLKRRIQMGELG